MGIRGLHPQARGDARTGWRRTVLGLLTLLVGLPACDSGEDPVPPETLPAVECPEGFRSGIVFGGCIEGVEIGDDSATVVAKLGEPTRYCGLDFCDLPTFFYSDLDDPRRRDSILVALDTNKLVGSVFALNGYMGRTREGVGLGTPRSEALARLGIPTETRQDPGDIVDIYQFADSIRFRVNYAPLACDSSTFAVDVFIMETAPPTP